MLDESHPHQAPASPRSAPLRILPTVSRRMALDKLSTTLAIRLRATHSMILPRQLQTKDSSSSPASGSSSIPISHLALAMNVALEFFQIREHPNYLAWKPLYDKSYCAFRHNKWLRHCLPPWKDRPVLVCGPRIPSITCYLHYKILFQYGAGRLTWVAVSDTGRSQFETSMESNQQRGRRL
jgi:hypothetical protein